jgi:hypothetical protein
VLMPNAWIQSAPYGLTQFRWAGGGAAQTAALMLYVVLAHDANRVPEYGREQPGMTDLTYSRLCEAASLSRAKVSAGLEVLISRGLISRKASRAGNLYQIANYNPDGNYAKLPARGLYDRQLTRVRAFAELTLRKKDELNFLKLYLLLVAIRDNSRNVSQISYEKIAAYSGMAQNDVRKALSLAVLNDLVHVDSTQSETEPERSSNIYRLRHLNNRNHRGTTERGVGMPFLDLQEPS